MELLNNQERSMVPRGWRRQTLILCVASSVVYAFFNLLAMVLYPGGTSSDKDVEGYRFFENFFSEVA